MEYLIYRTNIPSQYIDLQLTLQCTKNETVELQLPAWRPGRYELANYAQKIRFLQVLGNSGDNLKLDKVTKDRWRFSAPEHGSYRIHYQYHASQMDAGGSWSDDQQLYINFINLAFQIVGREQEQIKIRLNVPPDYKLATALPSAEPFVLLAEGFQRLVDSPVIASSELKHDQYRIADHTFHLWFQGEIHFNLDELKSQFANFTKKQIDAFGDFPATDYHFLFQLLPYAHYHGVEHQFSTVITLGPANDLKKKPFMDRLMGVSSHELYHFWNVCRIRPKELLPYDFSKEAYIDSGIVAEGVTTYMGDLFLWKSGYYSDRDYLDVLEKLINREFEQFGWRNQSIVESSWDLWLDGYKPGVPDRKVSIYNRGALLSLCLDLMLLDQKSSLSRVMKIMWENFGQMRLGYGLNDFQTIIAEELKNMDATEAFFTKFVYGQGDLLPFLQDLLETVSVKLSKERRDELSTDFGLILDEASTVKSVHPESPAYDQIMIGDVVQKQEIRRNQSKSHLVLSIERSSRNLSVELPATDLPYFMKYQLQTRSSPEKLMEWKNF